MPIDFRENRNSGAVQVSAMSWYALRVKHRSENLAVFGLRSKGFESFAPTYQIGRAYRNRKKIIEYPVFPGYIFSRFDPSQKFVILNSPAVMQIISVGNTIAPIEHSEIDTIRRAVAAGAYPVQYLKAGERVKIQRGALAGVEGVLLRSDGGPRVVISVDMLQRSIALSIEVDNLKPVELAASASRAQQ